MVQIFEFLVDINRYHIFIRICIMVTLIYVVASKPVNSNSTELTSDTKSENETFNTERQKIILELKSKILSRLKLDYLPPTNQSFNWDTVPDEMKKVFNDELEVENSDMENEEVKIETIVSPVVKSTTCLFNQSILARNCFDLTIPNLYNEDIISAKLIAPLKRERRIDFREAFRFNLSINAYKMVYDLSVDSKDSENVEIDMLTTFKEFVSKEFENIDTSANGSSLFLYIDGYRDNLRISEVIDVTKIVLEVQFKSSVLKRSKRSASNCKQNQYFCCRQTIIVDIRELELIGYITAPRYFKINYCKGDCNAHIRPTSTHSRTINIIRNQDTNVQMDMRSCCVPYSFSKQKIMYVNQEKTVRVEIFNDLSAASCGCL